MTRAMRIGLGLLLCGAGAASADPPRLATRLLQAYGSPAGYRAVRKDVMRWYGTTRNGCVAFLSTALRQIGVAVPERGLYDGERVSLLTRPLSLYLERELGFQRHTEAAELSPGDIVFTQRPEYPWHVYVFQSWKDRAHWLANVIDNQGGPHPRDLWRSGDHNWTPFAYALRPPE